VQLVAGAAVELEVARARGDVVFRLRKRLAAVSSLEQSELVRVIGDRAGQPREQAALLRRREPAPDPLVRMARRATAASTSSAVPWRSP
jgi:hypothetical protein